MGYSGPGDLRMGEVFGRIPIPALPRSLRPAIGGGRNEAAGVGGTTRLTCGSVVNAALVNTLCGPLGAGWWNEKGECPKCGTAVQ